MFCGSPHPRRWPYSSSACGQKRSLQWLWPLANAGPDVPATASGWSSRPAGNLATNNVPATSTRLLVSVRTSGRLSCMVSNFWRSRLPHGYTHCRIASMHPALRTAGPDALSARLPDDGAYSTRMSAVGPSFGCQVARFSQRQPSAPVSGSQVAGVHQVLVAP